MPFALFRADATPHIGAGHVRRCISLAHELAARGWRIGFAGHSDSLRMVPALSTAGYEWLAVNTDPERELPQMQSHFKTPDLLIIDHYGRGEVFENAGRKWARRTAALDDLANRPHAVDLLVDQTAGRTAGDYRPLVPPSAIILTGSTYVLLRPEISEQTPHIVKEKVERVIVTFGGSDEDDLSSRAVEALAEPRFKNLLADVVVGRGYRNPRALAAKAASNTEVAVDPPDLPQRMARADIAIAGSGTTAWELAFLGIPTLLITNSKGKVSEGMAASGAGHLLGTASAIGASQIADALAAQIVDGVGLAAMSTAGRHLIDGRGAHRVADAIEQLVA